MFEYKNGFFVILKEWTYFARKKLEYTCHTAFLISIVVCQWSNIHICRTRRRSLFQQGCGNWFLNFAIIFETSVACFLSYSPGMDVAFRMQPLRIEWWLLPLIFTFIIFIYDEMRKFFLRSLPAGSWMEKELYY